MPVIIPPGFAMVTVRFTPAGSGRPANSVFGASISDILGSGDVDQLSADLAVSYKQVLHTGGHYDSLQVLEGQDGGEPVEHVSTSGSGNGTRTGDLASPQVQGLIKKSTQQFGRKGTGRTFLPDMLESQINDDGSLSSGGMTVLSTFATQVAEAFVDSTTRFTGMVILHSSSTAPSAVTSYAAEAKVATLRPRYVR